jgi:fatty-acyl-CoA synthase
MSVASTGSRHWQDTVRFGDLLTRAAERDPGHEAVVFPDARVTYGELQERAFRVSRGLLSLGIGQRSRVGILMNNCIEFVELIFGISLVGGVVVPINARFAPRELGYVIDNGDLEVVFTSDLVAEKVDYVARLHDALPGLADSPDPHAVSVPAAPMLRTVVLLGGRQIPGLLGEDDFAAATERHDDEEVWARHRRTSLRDPALMMYTSGTTAMPKGCVLSHEPLVRTAVVGGRTKFRITPEDRFWDPLPMFHMSSILPLIGVFDGGGTFLSMTHFSAGPALAMLRDEHATMNFATFPAITQALLNHPDYTVDSWTHIKLVNNVAPPDTLRDMQRRMPHSILMSSYGLTECGGVVAFTDPEDPLELRVTTGGIPFDGIDLEVRDLVTGEPVPEGTTGEIVVRGYCVFDGYHKDPAKTAEVIDADGWFHTGDIGRLIDGHIAYLGRTKDMLKVGGENVAAIEIESFLATHPAVSVVAVVGVPDPKYMEVPAAFIELRPGHELGESEILAFAREGLARFKVPRHVRFVTEWPMSATKIQKFRLQEELTLALQVEREVGV